MAFDGFTIAALVSEMDAKLTGGHIQKIAQPEADELLLSIKNNKTQYKLQISASPSLPLIHLTNSPKPSPFTAPGVFRTTYQVWSFIIILIKTYAGNIFF